MLPVPGPLIAAAGASDCIVVRVVVRDRTDGAGDENVLSPPRREPAPLIVRLVPAIDDAAPALGASTDRGVPWSVETVGATDKAPAVGGARPSSLADSIRLLRRLRPIDVELGVTPLWLWETNEGWLRWGPL